MTTKEYIDMKRHKKTHTQEYKTKKDSNGIKDKRKSQIE